MTFDIKEALALVDELRHRVQMSDCWCPNSRAAASLTAARDEIERLRGAMRGLRHRAEKAEAERDTAWNDAIEAAATKVDQRKSILEVGTQLSDAIRALKKGNTP